MTPSGRKLARGTATLWLHALLSSTNVQASNQSVSFITRRVFEAGRAPHSAHWVPESFLTRSSSDASTGGEVQDLAVADVSAGILVLINNTFDRRMPNQRRLR